MSAPTLLQNPFPGLRPFHEDEEYLRPLHGKGQTVANKYYNTDFSQSIKSL